MSDQEEYSPGFLEVTAAKLTEKLRQRVHKRLLPQGISLYEIDHVIMSKEFSLGVSKADLIRADIERDYKEPWPAFITLDWVIDVAGMHRVPIIYVQWEFKKFQDEKLAYS